MIKLTRFLFMAALLLFAISANAQVTTSTLSGKVTESGSEVVIGATVRAVHEPSGILTVR